MTKFVLPEKRREIAEEEWDATKLFHRVRTHTEGVLKSPISEDNG
jgi:hypothetical protein